MRRWLRLWRLARRAKRGTVTVADLLEAEAIRQELQADGRRLLDDRVRRRPACPDPECGHAHCRTIRDLRRSIEALG